MKTKKPSDLVNEHIDFFKKWVFSEPNSFSNHFWLQSFGPCSGVTDLVNRQFLGKNFLVKDSFLFKALLSIKKALTSRASEFFQSYGNKGKGSGEQKFYCLVASRGSTMVGTKEIIFDFGRSRSLENAFLNVWFASIHQFKYGWY